MGVRLAGVRRDPSPKGLWKQGQIILVGALSRREGVSEEQSVQNTADESLSLKQGV
jgi:hypothetical protein